MTATLLRITKISIITMVCSVFLIPSLSEAKKAEYTASPHQLQINGKTYDFTLGVHNLKVVNIEKSQESKSTQYSEIKEVIVQFNQVDTIFKAHVPILYGRDLTGNGKFDSWFIIEEDGTISAVEELSVDEDGWDAAQDILKNKMKIHERSMASFLAAGLYAIFAPFTSTYQNAFFETVKFQMINLKSLEIQVKRLIANNSCNLAEQQAIVDLGEKIKEGWAEIAKRSGSNKYKSLPLEISADVALNLSYYLIPKYGSKLMNKYAPKATKAIKGAPGVEATLDFFRTQIKERAQRYASVVFKPLSPMFKKVGGKITQGVAMLGAAKVFVGVTVHDFVESSVAKLAMGNLASRLVGRSLGLAVSMTAKAGTAVSVTFMNSLKVWPLLIANQFGLFLGQAHSRWAEISKDGVDLRLIKNLMFNKDYLQDSVFHFNQTFWGNGIATYQGISPATKFVVMATFTVADSVFTTRVVKKESDWHRIIFDSGWEATAGVSENMLEIVALNKLTAEAKESGRPVLVFLGFTVVPLALQTTEMVVESPTSYWYEHSKWGKHSAEENAQKEAALKEKAGLLAAGKPVAQLPPGCVEPSHVYALPIGTLSEVANK